MERIGSVERPAPGLDAARGGGDGWATLVGVGTATVLPRSVLDPRLPAGAQP